MIFLSHGSFGHMSEDHHSKASKNEFQPALFCTLLERTAWWAHSTDCRWALVGPSALRLACVNGVELNARHQSCRQALSRLNLLCSSTLAYMTCAAVESFSIMARPGSLAMTASMPTRVLISVES